MACTTARRRHQCGLTFGTETLLLIKMYTFVKRLSVRCTLGDCSCLELCYQTIPSYSQKIFDHACQFYKLRELSSPASRTQIHRLMNEPAIYIRQSGRVTPACVGRAKRHFAIVEGDCWEWLISWLVKSNKSFQFKSGRTLAANAITVKTVFMRHVNKMTDFSKILNKINTVIIKGNHWKRR